MKKILVCLIAVVAIFLGLNVMLAQAAGLPAFVVETVAAAPGAEVKVNISLKNNPGITSIKLFVKYGEALTLKKIEYNIDGLGGQGQQPQNPDNIPNPVILNWINALDDSFGDCIYATLTFKVADDAVIGDYAITVTYDEDDIFNMANDNVFFDVINGNVTVACTHTWIWVVETPATEENEGLRYEQCTICNEIGKSEAIEKLAHTHNVEEVAAVEATHERAGNIEYYRCTKCGKLYKNAECKTEIMFAETVVAKIEHTYVEQHDTENHWKECICGSIIEKVTHTFGDWVVVKEATVSADGEKARYCSVCGYNETEKISKKETVTNTPQPTVPTESNKPSDTAPETGDEFSMILWTALMFICVICVGIFVVCKRKIRVK